MEEFQKLQVNPASGKPLHLCVYEADPNHSSVDPTGRAEKSQRRVGRFLLTQTAIEFLSDQPKNVASFKYLFDPFHDNFY